VIYGCSPIRSRDLKKVSRIVNPFFYLPLHFSVDGMNSLGIPYGPFDRCRKRDLSLLLPKVVSVIRRVKQKHPELQVPSISIKRPVLCSWAAPTGFEASHRGLIVGFFLLP